MRDSVIKVRTLLALGAWNLMRVASYRALLRFNLHPVQHIGGSIVPGRLFAPVSAEPLKLSPSDDWKATGTLFGWLPIAADQPSAWHVDHVTGCDVSGTDKPWWELPDFSSNDIKALWEPSRWNWLVPIAQRARNGDAAALDRLEEWTRDWIDQNPLYLGHNWKCAQEASIRVLHIAMAAVILGQDHALSETLRDLLRAHLQRIEPTLGYAAAQQNNHATSEGAALYIGGSWLRIAGHPPARGLPR